MWTSSAVTLTSLWATLLLTPSTELLFQLMFLTFQIVNFFFSVFFVGFLFCILHFPPRSTCVLKRSLVFFFSYFFGYIHNHSIEFSVFHLSYSHRCYYCRTSNFWRSCMAQIFKFLVLLCWDLYIWCYFFAWFIFHQLYYLVQLNCIHVGLRVDCEVEKAVPQSGSSDARGKLHIMPWVLWQWEQPQLLGINNM